MLLNQKKRVGEKILQMHCADFVQATLFLRKKTSLSMGHGTNYIRTLALELIAEQGRNTLDLFNLTKRLDSVLPTKEAKKPVWVPACD